MDEAVEESKCLHLDSNNNPTVEANDLHLKLSEKKHPPTIRLSAVDMKIHFNHFRLKFLKLSKMTMENLLKLDNTSNKSLRKLTAKSTRDTYRIVIVTTTANELGMPYRTLWYIISLSLMIFTKALISLLTSNVRRELIILDLSPNRWLKS